MRQVDVVIEQVVERMLERARQQLVGQVDRDQSRRCVDAFVSRHPFLNVSMNCVHIIGLYRFQSLCTTRQFCYNLVSETGRTFAYSNVARYYRLVIHSFADRDAERLWAREPVRRFPAELRRVMLRKLVQVDAAARLDDLRVPPGNRLEKLFGDRAAHHSIRINDQWRICFRWTGSDADDAAIVDYT